MATESSEELDQRKSSALSTSAKLVAKAAARAVGVLVAYAAVGAVFHWIAFWIAAGDIWSTFRAGPMGAHAGGVAVIFAILLIFTPQGLVTAIYLFGLPALCLFLGQKQALHAAVHRILRDKRDALVELVVASSMRVASVAGSAPGAQRAGAVARRLRDSVNGMDASRGSRFVLRALLGAIRLPELLSTTDLVARIKTDPETARGELRAAVEPRIAELGRPASFRPLAFVLALTTALTATRAWWCRLF